jgi:hypothetical protein
MMGLRYPIGEHAKKGMMVQTLQDGILKLNHLLSNELFKWRKACTGWRWSKITCHLEMLLEKKCIVVDFCSSFKKEGMIINHKPNNYD